MYLNEIAAYRLTAQQITGSSCKTPLEVVQRLGAIQAQDYVGSLWAIGLRMPAATRRDVIAAINNGDIIRTWPMRGTLHMVPAADARWMLRLMTPRIIAKSASRVKNLGLSDDIFAQSFAIFRKVLAGGKQMGRKELMGHLESHNIATADQRGYHILLRAAQEAVICMGPINEKEQLFVVFDEWVHTSSQLSEDEARATIARRYALSHGPVNSKELARWTGLTMRDAAKGLQAVQSELRAVTIDDVTYWMSPSITKPAKPDTYLLPGFDEYILGYGDRSAIMEDSHMALVVPGSNGMFLPTIIIDGRVAGTWKRSTTTKRINIALSPFRPLSKLEFRAVEHAARQYGRFVGLPVTISVGAS